MDNSEIEKRIEQLRLTIRPAQASDAAEWLRMRMALWPDANPDTEAQEIAHFLALPARPALPTLHAVFVCPRPDAGLCGLVEVSIRPYADGCETTDVGYLEAWYVEGLSQILGRPVRF